MSGDSVADDELAAFIDRILRMKAEEDAIKADIREIYAEAKGRGYDKTRLGEVVAHVRKVEKDANGEAEKEAIRDLYLTAYYRAKNKPHAHAYARAAKSTTQNTSVSEPFDPVTGEFDTTPKITPKQDAPHPASDLTASPSLSGQVATHPEAKASMDSGATAQGIEAPADSVSGDVSRASVGAGSDAPIQPETANEIHERASTNDEASPEAGPQAEASPSREQVAGTLADREARHEGQGATVTLPTPSETGKSVKASASAAPLSFADKIKRLRPNCQHPEACRSSGGKAHCGPCGRAAENGSAA